MRDIKNYFDIICVKRKRREIFNYRQEDLKQRRKLSTILRKFAESKPISFRLNLKNMQH